MKGIAEWDAKYRSFEPLFGAYGKKQVAKAILYKDSKSEVDDDEVDSLVTSFGTWSRVRPTGNTGRMFVDRLAQRLREMRERYDGFIAAVGRRLSRGTTLLDEITREIEARKDHSEPRG
jgi:hypothetical protein